MLRPGRVMPNFTLPALDGKEHKLSQFFNEKIALFIWASWCPCREQLPEWQQLHQKYRGRGVEIVCAAVDALGVDRVRPYVEGAGATFTTLIDERNLLGRTLGFKAVPSGVLIDENLLIHYMRFGGFDIRAPGTRAHVERWLEGEPIEITSTVVGQEQNLRSQSLFGEGVSRLRAGERSEAVDLWRQAVNLDPENDMIRNQLWALEHPERFYDDEVDTDWQRRQFDKGS